MIDYRTYRLDNGLTVITHEAWDTPLASVSLLYAVGSRDEDPHRTGFAHLFEHLMFGGTPRVPDFDSALHAVGGDSNAATGSDYTHYYCTLPADELGLILDLEADRMQHLDISQQALQVQQQVVTEEYHQRYCNTPYGDVWLLLRPLCYKTHPYRWATIGADIRHVSEATLEDVRHFHSLHYRPDNAILTIAAPCTHQQMVAQAERAWGSTASATSTLPSLWARPTLPQEAPQTEARQQTVHRNIPASSIYLAYPMGGFHHPHFQACDMLTDILAGGKSSRLYRRLVQESGLFIEADAYITAECDNGLLILSGKLHDSTSPEQALDALRTEAMRLAKEAVSTDELRKNQNRYECNTLMSQYKAMDRAFALGYYTFLGDTALVNQLPARCQALTPEIVQQAATDVFRTDHENALFYLKG